MVTRLVKIFEDLKNNRQYFMLSSLRGSVGFPGCLKRPFKVSELEYSGIFHENSCTGASLWTMHFLIRWNPSLLLFLLFLYYTLRIQILCFSFRFFNYLFPCHSCWMLAFLYSVVATDIVSPSNGDYSAEMWDDI
jgi:hypothetical protein